MPTEVQTQVGEVVVQTSQTQLDGILATPERALGLVVFAHGSGSSRLSARNQFVASSLNQHHLATLLFDLLTPEEHRIDQQTRGFRFDMELLTQRLVETVDWTRQQSSIQSLPVGLFGASTGAAAALRTAAERPESVSAVVSRGGRPDLAGDALASVACPTLLIIGGLDTQVIELNEQAARQLNCECRTEIVPGASHLFEEPGKLEQVARLSGDWFASKLPPNVGGGV